MGSISHFLRCTCLGLRLVLLSHVHLQFSVSLVWATFNFASLWPPEVMCSGLPWILPAPPFAFTLSRLRQFLCFGPGPPAFPPNFHPLSPSRLPFPFWPGRSAVLLPDFLHNFAAWLALSSFCWLLLLAAPSFRTYFSPLSSCLCYPMCYWHCCWRHSVNSLWPFQLVIHLKPHTMTKCSICFAHLRLLLHLPSPNHI